MRRPLIAVTLTLGALVAVWGALVLLDLLARSEQRTTRPLDVAGGLVLETDTGDVEVVAASGPPRLELRSVRGLFGGPGTRVERDGDGVLSVRTNCTGPFALSCEGSARVLVPAGTRVELSTGSGELRVRGTRGGVRAETGSGDVRLDRVGGREVIVDTGSGEVSGAEIEADVVRAQTGSGDVRLGLARPPADVLLDTGSGAVDLAVPDVGYAIETDTGSGDERVDVRRDDGSPRRLRLETGSGDVTVRPSR